MMQQTISLSDVLMMDHQMTEQTTTPLVVIIRLLVEEDVELYLLLISVSIAYAFDVCLKMAGTSISTILGIATCTVYYVTKGCSCLQFLLW